MSLKRLLISLVFLLTMVVVPSTVFAVGPATVLPKTATSTADLLRPKGAAARLNGTISAVGATSLTVGNTTVNVSTLTVLLRKYGARARLAEFSVGDQISVMGSWANAPQTTINARVIRDLSIQKRRGVFLGKVTSLTSAGFVLTPEKRPAQTVGVNLLTKYVDRGEKPIVLAAIKTGDKVMVKGLWDNKLNTITEVTFVRDYSLPLLAPKAATKSGALFSGTPPGASR